VSAGSHSTEVAVFDNEEESRYEASVGGRLAGFAAYRAKPGLVAFTHTEVDDSFSGQGVGSRLVAAALDDSRAKQRAVLPFCPFVNRYIAEHPEYLDLVPAAERARFGL
jgi:uncharacterized protein